MKKFFIGALIIICVWLVKVCTEVYFKAKMSEQQKEYKSGNIDEDLKELAEAMNSELPMKVDEITELSRVECHKNREIRYCYTILSDNLTFTSTEIEEYRKRMLQVVKQSVDLNKFKEYQVTMSYAYYNLKGDCIAFIKIYPKDYQ